MESSSKHDEKPPVDIEYRNLSFRVVSKDEADGVFYILKNLNGTCRSGRLHAILGPSGAGKTTLVWPFRCGRYNVFRS